VGNGLAYQALFLSSLSFATGIFLSSSAGAGRSYRPCSTQISFCRVLGWIIEFSQTEEKSIMLKRTTFFASILMALAILVSACAPAASNPASAPVVVQDGEGKEFRLEKPAQKIISLAPSNTEILFAIGAGKQVVAREDFANYPEEVKNLPSVGGSTGKYSLEQIAKFQPDLILASPLTAPDVLKSLKDVTPNVLVIPNPKDMEGLFTNLVTVGTLTGHKAEADKLVSELRARVKTVQDKLAKVADKPTVYYELDATDPAKPWTAGPGTFIDLLIGMAGGQNIGSSLSGDWAQISQEDLIVKNPDVILLGDSLYGGIKPEQVAARPGWDGIGAVKNNRVLEFNDDLVSRPGPRMVQGLEELARILHPDLMK
jgi:iron complex transport system substrate-binding protein